MKRALAIVLSLLLILTGCQTVPDNPTDGTTTIPETTDTTPSSDPEETSQATGETTEPVEETTTPILTENQKLSNAMREYTVEAMLYYGRYIFEYDGQIPDHVPQRDKIDESKLINGYTYMFHEKEEKCYVLLESGGKSYITQDHVFMSTKREPNVIYRLDYFGNEQKWIYKGSGKEISYISYYGTNPNGKLLIIEDYLRAVLIDVQTAESFVLWEEEGLITFQLDFREDLDEFWYVYETGEGVWLADPAGGEPIRLI